MNSTTLNDKTEKVEITLPNSLVKQTDKMCGDVPRSTYIRRAIGNYLKQGKTR
ncbi:MAG: ribbon-helix-helix domain-containing protein [Candidatus Nitrosopolaris sp.]